MDTSTFEKLLEAIAERMVMDDLADAAAREGLARMFADVRAAAGARFPVSAEACAQAEQHCAKAKPAKDLSKRLEGLLKKMKREILDGVAAPPPQAAKPEAPAPEAAAEPAPVIAPEEALAEEPAEPGVTSNGILEALPPECDPELLREFLVEAREHMENSDAQLLILEQSPKNDEALNAVFRAFHSLKGLTGFLGLVDIQRIAHESENLLERARKGSIELAGSFFDITFEAVDALKKLVQNVEVLQQGGRPSNVVNVPELLAKLEEIQKSPAPHAETAEAAEPPAPAASPVPEPLPALESVLTAAPAPSTPPVLDAPRPDLAEPSGDRAAGAAARTASAEGLKTREVLKVDAERLDRLVDMIGELVIAESMVSQAAELRGASTTLTRHLGQLDKITRELQEIGTSLRMIPIKATFQRMARLVRDVARKSNKQVEFVTIGEDTELDKTVVEKIGDPLVHMIRNSVDHGIECDPKERLARGKPAAGRVELQAYHRGGNIYIEIGDDGRGLNKDAILAKARERGLVQENETPSDREIYNLIFAPGLSTAKAITDVSGRGVGMDVVKRNIEALRGQIDIQTEVGRGTTFTIRLPLTLAIIDG
ncbi:MAG: chemotaxis protein CheA, partial [Planctomycetota bacterium]|nr:chemotaxis protein CheA [Planctomycetota bacterium]